MDSLQQPHVTNPFTDLPRASKILAAILVAVFLIAILIPSTENIFALIPGYTIPPHFYVWNIFTSGYFEHSPVITTINVISVLLFGRYLEPIWGSKEYIRFVIIVNVFCGLGTFALMMVLTMISGSTTLWFSARYGFSGVISGYAVAMKQLVPEQELNHSFIRCKHFPAIVLFFNLVFVLVGLPSGSLPYSLFGIFISWIYLRFYQVKDSSKGDRNESFSFASFFPEPLQPTMTIISNVLFNILKLVRLCKDSGNVGGETSTEGGDSVSERRRARALRALDHRMQLLKATSQTDISSSIREAIISQPSQIEAQV